MPPAIGLRVSHQVVRIGNPRHASMLCMRHHALESGCFVVTAMAWPTDAQVAGITPDPGLQKAGGCCTAIISPQGAHLAPPLREGEGMVIADVDASLTRSGSG